MKKIIIALITTMAVVFAMFSLTPAFGTDDPTPNCDDPTVTVVVEEAYDETVIVEEAYTEYVEHAAVTETIHHEAVPAGPDLWWNWSPNHQQGPFDGPPAFPIDPRGTWQGPHENGGPSQDIYGTFQQGNGHGSWFHRERGTPGVDAYDEVIVIEEAYTETIEHPAVTDVVHHPEVTEEQPNPDYPCEEPTPTDPVDPTDPVEPTEPTDPVVPNEPNEPTEPNEPVTPVEPREPDVPVTVRECVGNSLMVKVTEPDGDITTYYVDNSPQCDTGEPVREEGM